MSQNSDAEDLGLVPPKERISAQDCFQRANRRVVYPALAIMIVGYVIIFLVAFAFGFQNLEIKPITDLNPGGLWKAFVYASLFVVGLSPLIPMALWMSHAAQQWRIWAIQNVDSWPELEKLSEIKSGRKWPRPTRQSSISSAKLLEMRLISYRDNHDDR